MIGCVVPAEGKSETGSETSRSVEYTCKWDHPLYQKAKNSVCLRRFIVWNTEHFFAQALFFQTKVDSEVDDDKKDRIELRPAEDFSMLTEQRPVEEFSSLRKQRPVKASESW